MGDIVSLQRLKLPELTAEQEQAYFAGAQVLGRFMGCMPGTDFAVLRMIFSETFAMGRHEAPISLQDFVDGYHDARGFHGGTGLSRSAVQTSLRNLLAAGFISRRKTGAYRHPYRYQVHLVVFVKSMLDRVPSEVS